MAQIPAATMDRTIVFNMRAKRKDEIVAEDIDREGLGHLAGVIGDWAGKEETRERIKAIVLGDEAAFLGNRKREIWRPLLSIAKSVDEGWYKKALEAAKFFTKGRKEKTNIYHEIFLGCYELFNAKNIRMHSIDVLEELYGRGIPKWVDQSYLAKALGSYDPDIAPDQFKINGINKRGYETKMFERAWKEHLNEEEIVELQAGD